MSAGSGGVAGMTGTPAAIARLRAATLLPSVSHGFGRGADEENAGGGASSGELRVLGQEAVAGMDRIDLRLARDPQNVRDIQIGLDRARWRPTRYASSDLVRCSEKRSSCE